MWDSHGARDSLQHVGRGGSKLASWRRGTCCFHDLTVAQTGSCACCATPPMHLWRSERVPATSRSTLRLTSQSQVATHQAPHTPLSRSPARRRHRTDFTSRWSVSMCQCCRRPRRRPSERWAPTCPAGHRAWAGCPATWKASEARSCTRAALGSGTTRTAVNTLQLDNTTQITCTARITDMFKRICRTTKLIQARPSNLFQFHNNTGRHALAQDTQAGIPHVRVWPQVW